MKAPPASAPVIDRYAGMNKTQIAFAVDLDSRKRSGQIAEWWFRPATFRLSGGGEYTPPFMVQSTSGELSVADVGYGAEDARIKIKMFAELYPFPTKAFTRAKTHSGWDVETFR